MQKIARHISQKYGNNVFVSKKLYLALKNCARYSFGITQNAFTGVFRGGTFRRLHAAMGTFMTLCRLNHRRQKGDCYDNR